LWIFILTWSKAGRDTFVLCRAAGTTGLGAGSSLRKRGQPMFKSMKNFAANESGATAIEYALIASLIAVFIITAVQTVGTKVRTVFTEIGSSLK
jgi:pilus assembly protein Flp/PilA